MAPFIYDKEGGASSLPDTFVKCFLQSVRDFPDYPAFSTLDGEVLLTWKGTDDRVKAFAAGLYSLGVRRGDLVALIFKPRYEFAIADLAILCVGATPFSVYPTLPGNQIAPLLQNADSRIAICEKAFLPQLLAARKLYPELQQIVVLEGNGPEGTIDWATVETPDSADPFDFEASVAAVKPDDLLTIIYTSGTTGDPKGCELTHANVMNTVKSNRIWRPEVFTPGKRLIGWLPTAHVAERFCIYYMGVIGACNVAYCQETPQIADAFRRYKPQVSFSPPRFWEKIKEAIEAKWGTLPDPAREGLKKGLQASADKVRLEQAGKPVGDDLAKMVAVADETFFAPVRAALGFDGEGAFFGCGGASILLVVEEFMHAIGVAVNNVYGMSETAAAGPRSPVGRQRLGSIGTAIDIDAKVAEDGELIIRSPSIMRGYRKRPDLTAEAIDADGWFHTGDIVTIDADGYYRIIDRKKDIMINSMGHNLSPAHLERTLISAGPFISQAMVIGEARKFVTALVTLDSSFVKAWAEKQGLDTMDFESLVHDPKIRLEVEKEVNKANESLARVEQIKRFHLVGSEWLPGMEEMTPTMKLKRPVVNRKYAVEIEAMYKD